MRFSALSKMAVMSLLIASASTAAFAGHHSMPANNYKDTFKDAAPCPVLPSLMSGFYVGAQAGYDAYRLHSSSSDSFASSSVNASLTGWVGGLFVGYGQYFNDMYYLGGELLGNYNGASHTISSGNDNDGDTWNVSGKAKGTWGLSLLPGLKLNETTLGYVRLGYDWTNFEISGNATDGATGGSISGSKSSTQGGFDFGLGMETLVYQNWSVRTEYNHVWYSSTNNNINSISPSDNQFMLGVVYHM